MLKRIKKMSNLIRDVEFKYDCISFNVLDEYAITPKLLADAMHWVVTGDEALLASNYAFI